ncbi:MAG TPA: hypothetical protein PKM22_00295 [Candidatus Hydrogenedentes bacterium]|jgi:hypothetical protein|nr:hypothetical protein [Candidatus Hydrogenedentota bacterium]MDY0030312.1 hypothetical protein [FCB group bacterium]HNV20053.1 hypothetical protein [Candidatus Hydrogenedentota bacterium]HNZ18253.1 hypothetical protein [Candidatus Hydrogenedentota bacterium]HOH33476.1 hypothetical protein [Candidatus Hydrogenedentota bacterium]
MAHQYTRTLTVCGMLVMGVFVWAATGLAEPVDEAASSGFGTSAADERSKWFLIFGVANVQPRLETSEAQIDRQINGLLGRAFPRWEEPRTFATWRDEFRVWDLHVGFGRELTPNWVWVSTFGGSLGTVRNEDRYYPLGIPAMFHVDFSRKFWFASTGILYYPWGQAVYEPADGAMERFRRSLRGTRPFVGVIGAYLDLRAEAVVKIDLPLTSFDPRIVQKQRTRPVYISPRIGVDVPLTEQDDLVLAAGYLFFCEDGADLDNWSYYVMYKHKFKSSGND